MKINKYFLCGLAFAGAGLLASCSDELETQPTNSVSGTQVFENAEHAEAAINGAYRFCTLPDGAQAGVHRIVDKQQFNCLPI